MKRLLVHTSLVAILIAGVGEQPATAKKIEQIGMTWYTTLPEGLQAAAMQGKPIFLDFWDHRSQAYERLFEKTYKDPRVKIMFSKFVLVTLNIIQENAMARTFRVNQVPVILFLDRSGRELGRHRVAQFVSADLLIERMESVLGDLEAFGKLREKVQREPDDYDSVLKVGQVLEGWLREPEAIACYKKIAEATGADREVRELAREGWSRSLLAFGNRSGLHGDHTTALRCIKDFLKLFPKHEMVSEAKFMLTLHLIHSGQGEEARNMLEQLERKTKGKDKKRAKAFLKALPPG